MVENDTTEAITDTDKTKMRLQVGNLKKKIKEAQNEIAAKDAEIEKLRAKTSDKVKQDLDSEMRRAYDVLRHLKKKIGGSTYNEEYRIVMSEIRSALKIGKKSTHEELELASDEEESKVLDVAKLASQSNLEIISLCLPWFDAKDLIQVATLNKASSKLVNEFAQNNSEHVCFLFKQEPRNLSVLSDAWKTVIPIININP